MAEAIVNKIIPFSSVDGPGNRTVVFLQGCNLECKYCHNPETIKNCVGCGTCVKACRTGALVLVERDESDTTKECFDAMSGTSCQNDIVARNRVEYDASKCIGCDECIHSCPNMSSPKTSVMTAEDVISKVLRNMPFIRGITVSGGECTRQRDFLYDLLGKAKELGLTTLIDSNGTYDFSKDDELLSVTDGVMLDIKAFGSKDHINVTGSDNLCVLNNLKFLLEKKKLTEVRTVIVPELFDVKETVTKVSGILADNNQTDVRYKIIKYRVNGVREDYKCLIPPTDELLSELKAIAVENGLTDVVII